MKNLFQKKIFVLLIAVSACSLLNTKSNLNGGFEIVTNDVAPDGWFANNLPQTKKFTELSLDNSVAHSGNRSIKISISRNHPSQSIIYNWVRRIDGLNEGETYELEGWVKLKNIKVIPFFTIEFWNKDVSIGTASTSKNILDVENKNWQLIKTIFCVPKTTSKIFIRAGISGMRNNGGIVWFDDLVLSKVIN